MTRPAHVYVTYIKTTPAKLWEALTHPDFTRRYFHRTAVESPWSKGSPVYYRQEDGEIAVDGEVLEVEPERRLVITWHVRYHDAASRERPSRVSFEIEPLGAACKLTLVHDDFPEGSVVYPEIQEGWIPIVCSLKSLLETGEPLPLPGVGG